MKYQSALLLVAAAAVLTPGADSFRPSQLVRHRHKSITNSVCKNKSNTNTNTNIRPLETHIFSSSSSTTTTTNNDDMVASQEAEARRICPLPPPPEDITATFEAAMG
mmetsp:Transcript_13209/g.37178  ORF Transcript_13209/g.37178 Transcript_13209/m.37178 type:complete len:107 (-) Transcript_13209:721-1041(-)